MCEAVMCAEAKCVLSSQRTSAFVCAELYSEARACCGYVVKEMVWWCLREWRGCECVRIYIQLELNVAMCSRQ